ncbi:MAG: hypothetical protein ACJ8DC_00025 [Gemmatimonadales bacterium]
MRGRGAPILVGVVSLAALGWWASAWLSGRIHPSSRHRGGKFTATQYLYGLGPQTDPSVRYQPDVVIVGGGPASVRSVSSDGLIWTIRGDAPGIGEVQVGKVMFVTSRGVGRVLRREQVGRDVAVVLGPVDLTDVIRDGTIKIDEPIDLRDFAFVHTPDLPGTVRELPALVTSLRQDDAPVRYADARGSALSLPPVRLVAMSRPVAEGPQQSLPAPTFGTSLQIAVGRFLVEPSAQAQGMVVRIAYGPSANWVLKRPPHRPDGSGWGNTKEGSGWSRGLELGITLTLRWSDPKLQSSTVVKDGKVEVSDTRLDGLKQIDVDIDAGSKSGLADNISQRLEIPVDLVLPVTGTPFVIALRQKFLVQTAFTAKNSTLSAHGSYAISGPLTSKTSGGNTSASSPTIQVRQSLLSSLRGVSVGVNGIVVGWSVRVVFGFGIPEAFVGPHVGLTLSSTVTRGSDLGIVLCRQASADAAVNTGLGFKLEPTFIDWLKNTFIRGKSSLNTKLDSDLIDANQTIFHWEDTEPNVALCKNKS